MLYRQALAALLPPGLEDSAPAFGFHPCPKAVHAFAASLFGLPRSFRHTIPSPVSFTAGNYTLFSPCLQVCDGSRKKTARCLTGGAMTLNLDSRPWGTRSRLNPHLTEPV
jgi:hypothetical protein